MSDRILIVPGGQFQLTLIQAAKRRALKTVVADGNPNAPGLKLADFSEDVNPTDIDALIDVAKHHSVIGVVSIASDPCVIPCARVAKALGLPGLPERVAERARSKHASLERIRDIAPEFCPRFVVIPSLERAAVVAAEIGFPLVLKPQAANGSKGVVIVDSKQDFADWYQYVTRFSAGLPIIAEERLNGPEVSVETWSVAGEVHVIAIVDKMTTRPPYCVEVGHTTPSRLERGQIAALSEAARRIVRTLEIDDGPAHNELILTTDGPKFVETGARLGGGCIASHLVPLSAGVDLVEASLDLALGQSVDLTPSRTRGAAIRFLRPTPGTVASIRGLAQARAMDGVIDVACTLEHGSEVLPLQNSDQRVGYVVAEGADASAAAKNAQAALERVEIVTE